MLLLPCMASCTCVLTAGGRFPVHGPKVAGAAQASSVSSATTLNAPPPDWRPYSCALLVAVSCRRWEREQVGRRMGEG